MTVAVTAGSRLNSDFAVRPQSIWNRLVSIGCLMAADLSSFALADLAIRLFYPVPSFMLFQGTHFGERVYIDVIAGLAVMFVLARYVVGDYSQRKMFWDGARNTTNALMLCGLPYLASLAIFGLPGLVVNSLAWFGLLFLVPYMRHGMRYVLGRVGVWYIPSAIIGTSDAAQEVYRGLDGRLSLGLRMQWVVSDSPDAPMPPAMAGLRRVNAEPESLVSSLVALGCRQVIWVPDDRLPLAHNDLVDQFVGADIRVAIVPSMRRLPLFGLTASSFFGKDILFLQARNNLARLPQRVLKRGLDIVGALSALVFLSPLLLLLSWLIKREDGGPVFFGQSRVGRNGEDFVCWKFRSMVTDAETQLSRWEHDNPHLLEQYRQSNFKLAEDPRLTRIGAWMRRKSLDELPQLFNVLAGEMSLVGPRPLLRRELPDYGAVINLYARVRPGITGMWQTSGRSRTTFSERVSYDEWYIKNWTLWCDVVIVLRTIRVLLYDAGAY